MKRLFFAVALAVAFASAASAQQMPPIPVDPAVRVGKLDNGLTYYIRHNEEPKGQANFYIAQKVGSILEDENQRGLAHFLEHMCFNGTKKFPGNRVIKYCESIGVKFGADLNAYTSIDETVYNIDNVPVTTTPSAIDSCLWILHDWAGDLLLEGDDIDHERGVIHEEWRSRMGATMRQYEKILPVVYPGNRYGVRLPIGTMDVVDNFPYEAIRAYYRKWYRPDQQAIVVVGDIEVDAIETKIRDIFGTLTMPENPAERVYYGVEDNAEPIVCMTTDKEQPYAITYIFNKHEVVKPEDKGNLDYMLLYYMKNAASIMLNQRLEELANCAEPPFVQAAITDEEFFVSKTKGALAGISVTSETGLAKGATTVYREMLRALRGGFTASEYERAKAQILTMLESQYNQRSKTKSASYCREYVRHFIDNEPIPGIENEYALAQQIMPAIPVEAVNKWFSTLSGNGGLVVTCMLPEKEGVSYPSEGELLAMLKAVEAEDIAPYVDKVSDEPLVSNMPAPGRVVKKAASKLGYTALTLSNGVKVYYKSTDFNPDEIRLYAKSFGGTSVYKPEEAINLKVADEVLRIGGLGAFSATDLPKVLAGKRAGVESTIGLYTESVKGSSSVKDFETMLQLVWLNFTAPRADAEAFESWKNKTKAMLLNAEKDPMSAFQDTLNRTVYVSDAYVGELKAADVDKVDYDRVMQIGAERFANAADFQFILTGAIDEATAIPLIEQYLGALPTAGKKEKCRENKLITYRKGANSNVFSREMEMPTATILFLDHSPAKYNQKQTLLHTIAGQTLSMVLLEEIREKEGGTYGISASCKINNLPVKRASMQIYYKTNPDRYEYLNGRIAEIVSEFAAKGPSAENLAKAKEYLAKKYKENLRENKYWQSAFAEYLESGLDFVADYQKTLDSVTASEVANVVSSIKKGNKKGGSIEIIMKGEAAK